MPLIFSLDGNIGAGKSTLLEQIRQHLPEVHVVEEPVGQWTALKTTDGRNLLELFYEDRKRWAYTFQNCAIMTRFKNIQQAVHRIQAQLPVVQAQPPVVQAQPPVVQAQQQPTGPRPVILMERSILTDKHVFAEMLRDSGDMDPIEWDLYNCWFDTFSEQYPVHGIIYLSTSSVTSKERIGIRGRSGEDKIDMAYLDLLDAQHKRWIDGTHLPVLTLSTEPDSDLQENLERIRAFVQSHSTTDCA